MTMASGSEGGVGGWSGEARGRIEKTITAKGPGDKRTEGPEKKEEHPRSGKRRKPTKALRDPGTLGCREYTKKKKRP